MRADLRTGVFPTRGFGLLALLALAPGSQLTRTQAAAHLWDSRDTSASLSNLRQLLLRMQRSFPGLRALLGLDSSALWLTEQREQIDLCRLLSITNEPPTLSLTIAMSLYRGDLLQGQLLSGALGDVAAHSVALVRNRYFSVMTQCITEIVRYGRADASLLQSAEFHMLSIDGSREETYRTLIAAYGSLGRVDEARRVYKILSEVLKLDGLGAPVAETRSTVTRATARVVENRAEWPVDRKIAHRVPRLALLAPRWVVGAHSGENFHRLFVEDIANELARYRSHVTIAAHSAFQVQEDSGLVLANQTLRADYSLSSVVRSGEELGVLSVRLVQTQSAAIIWTREFPLGLDQLVVSSRLLIAQLAAEISGAIERDSFVNLRRTDNPSSYLMFLQGQSALKTSDLRSVRRARKEYRAAIGEDDGFAEAYSGLSCSLYLEWILLGGNDPRLLADARELAEAAIKRDPASSAGYWRKADVLLYQHDFDGCEEYFRRAAELHPNSADIILDHGDALGFIGDAEEAWGMFEKAIELNPMPPEHYWWVGASIAFSQTHYDKVIELCGRVSSEEPVLRLLAAAHGQLGNLSEAREYGRRLAEVYPGQSAEEMTRLQPHRSKRHLQPFVEGLHRAGIS